MTPDRPGPGLGRNTTCRSCQAPIAYAVTRADKRIPLDVDDHGAPRYDVRDDGTRWVGNVAIVDGVAEVRSGLELAMASQVTAMYVPHHASCPHAGDWRPAAKR